MAFTADCRTNGRADCRTNGRTDNSSNGSTDSNTNGCADYAVFDVQAMSQLVSGSLLGAYSNCCRVPPTSVSTSSFVTCFFGKMKGVQNCAWLQLPSYTSF